MKKIIFILISLIGLNSFAGEAVRLKEIARIQGVRSNQLLGLGLVIGLNGTGDKKALTPQMLKNLYKFFGTEIAQNQIESKNVAAVIVTAELPPFKRIGDTIDVTISSVNDAKSLEGGVLLQTVLKSGTGENYAVAQGSLNGVQNRTSNRVNAVIANGAMVEKEVEMKLENKDKVVLLLENPDFTTATRIVDVINKRFSYDTAVAVDAAKIEIKKSFSFGDDIVGFISSIENLKVIPDRKSLIVINEKTGTIVLGENIAVAAVAISHGDLSLNISGDKEGVAEEGAEGEVSGETSFFFKGSTVKDVVTMLNALGAKPQDIIEILHSLKASGAIDAKLKII